jgi:CcmD family protein
MRLIRSTIVVALLALPMTAVAQPPPSPPPGQEGFVPIDQIPPEEKIPALNLVAAAYGFVWFVLVGYVWSLGSRLNKVERELSELEGRRR